MTLKVQVVPVTPYQQNCSIIQCEATGLAAIVDPGGDIERIEAAIPRARAVLESGEAWALVSRWADASTRVADAAEN